MPYIHNISTNSGYFIGWDNVEEHKGPGFTDNVELAFNYDLSFQKQEALEDYEALVNQGHEPSLDTAWVEVDNPSKP